MIVEAIGRGKSWMRISARPGYVHLYAECMEHKYENLLVNIASTGYDSDEYKFEEVLHVHRFDASDF